MQNTSRSKVIVSILIVVLAVAGVAYWALHGSNSQKASAVVSAFGSHLKDVPLLSPDASSTMASVYGPYVDPSLLAAWQASPQDAPGRAVSSPWPDSIVVDSLQPQGQGYIVNGHIVFMTSSGQSGTTPVILLVTPENGRWLIAAFQSASAASSTAQ